MLKTIFDFILSLGHLFFRGKGGARQYCLRCGALLRAGSPCGCYHPSDGSGPGGCRGAAGMEKAGETGTAVETEEEGEPSSSILQQEEDAVSLLMGWALMAAGVVLWAVGRL